MNYLLLLIHDLCIQRAFMQHIGGLPIYQLEYSKFAIAALIVVCDTTHSARIHIARTNAYHFRGKLNGWKEREWNHECKVNSHDLVAHPRPPVLIPDQFNFYLSLFAFLDAFFFLEPFQPSWMLFGNAKQPMKMYTHEQKNERGPKKNDNEVIYFVTFGCFNKHIFHIMFNKVK